MSIRLLVPIAVLALTIGYGPAKAQIAVMPVSSNHAVIQLYGKTGSIRSTAIAQVAPYLKADLTAQETADILGTASELSEAPRANAIQSFAGGRNVCAFHAHEAAGQHYFAG